MPFQQYPELLTYPDSTLRDIARNDACPKDFRMHAVELLVVRKSPYTQHEDLADLIRDLAAEFEGVVLEYPPPEQLPFAGWGDSFDPPGPLKASVTTQTMFAFDSLPKEPEDATGGHQ